MRGLDLQEYIIIGLLEYSGMNRQIFDKNKYFFREFACYLCDQSYLDHLQFC